MTKQIGIIRRLLGFFIVALFLSGLTAIPVEPELSFLLGFFPDGSNLHSWLARVLAAYREVNAAHPFLLYEYDWLAFAHFILAILFIGPYKDPVKNLWVIQFGLIACALILSWAFIAGTFRGIPLGWQLIDCSFGVFGAIPLWICYRKAKQLSQNLSYSSNQ